MSAQPERPPSALVALVNCPQCGVPAGQPCLTSTGRLAREMHLARRGLQAGAQPTSAGSRPADVEIR